MKILIGVPPLRKRGGVAAFFATLEDPLSSRAEYFQRGSREGENGILRLLRDYLGFLRRVVRPEARLVHCNTSLGAGGVLRDAVFLVIAGCLGKKRMVFFHGWDLDFQRRLERRGLWLFKKTFLSADAIVVLSRAADQTLRAWGYSGPVYLETTVIDNLLLNDPSLDEVRFERCASGKQRILFLARIERTKGVYELVEAFELLRQEFPDLALVFAGDGTELPALRRHVEERGLNGIEFRGFVEGRDKTAAFREADLYVLPSYGEGLPISVLEAMAAGLPVVATAVGGLADLIEEGRMGSLVAAPSPEILAQRIRLLLRQPDARRQIGLHNRQFAREYFSPARVAERLERIWNEVLSSESAGARTRSWRGTEERTEADFPSVGGRVGIQATRALDG